MYPYNSCALYICPNKKTGKIKTKLNNSEKKALIELKKSLKKKNYTEEQLFNEFYSICQKTSIKNTEFFDAAYRVIIGKRKGPRLASLILIVEFNEIRSSRLVPSRGRKVVSRPS